MSKEHDWAKKGLISQKVSMPYCAFVFAVKSNTEITLCGWHLNKDVNEGDSLILPNSGETTRYRIEKIRPCNDSSGMFFIDCIFNPRTKESE